MNDINEIMQQHGKFIQMAVNELNRNNLELAKKYFRFAEGELQKIQTIEG